MTIETKLHSETQKSFMKIADGLHEIGAIFKIKDILPALCTPEQEFILAYAEKEYDFVSDRDKEYDFVSDRDTEVIAMTKELKGIQEFIDTYAPMMYEQGHLCQDEDGQCAYTKGNSHCFIGFAIHQYLDPNSDYGNVYSIEIWQALEEAGYDTNDMCTWSSLQACHDSIAPTKDFKETFKEKLKEFCRTNGYKMPKLKN